MTTRTDNGWTLTAGALAVVAMSALAVTAGGPIAPRAEAAAPGIAASCGGAVVTKDAAANAALAPVAQPDDGNPATPLTYAAGPVRTSVINVAGAQPYLRDVDLRTLIKHTASKDVNISLTAPNGKTVLINSGSNAGSEKDTYNPPTVPGGYVRNGGSHDDEWNGTRWDDQGGTPVNDFNFPGVDDATATPLIEPEGSLGNFIGINPNGNWTLSVQNSAPHYPSFSQVPPANPVEDPDIGTFTAWGLDLSTLPAAPVLTPLSASNATVVPIPDSLPAGITQTITIAGAQPGQTIADVDLLAKLPHVAISDLVVTLKSPAGTEVTIASDPGREELSGTPPNDVNYPNALSDTRWDDSAAEPVTDAAFVNGVNKPTLQPEEALAAFAGENPNGAWSLKVVDNGARDEGTLQSATLEIKTSPCSGGAGVVTPPPPPPPPPPVTTAALKIGIVGSAKRSVKYKAKLATVKITLTREAKITAVLVRGKKKIKSLTKAGVTGTNTIRIRLPKKAGKYVLKVTALATDGATNAKVITITKKLPR
jgi:subtilisin-like proprotein convertase family protein